MHACVSRILVRWCVPLWLLFFMSAPAQGGLRPTPSAIHFRSHAVGSATGSIVTLTNDGVSPTFHIVKIAVSGANFSIPAALQLPVTLAPGHSYSVDVTFAPHHSGESVGALVFTTHYGWRIKVPLSGTGTTRTGEGQLTAPSALNFGSVNLGNTSIKTFDISNSGSSKVDIWNLVLSGRTIIIAGISSGLVLSPGQTVSASATFSAVSTGNSAGSLTVVSDAANSPSVISWTATTPSASYWVTLSWTVSSSSDVVGYKVYRGNRSGGPYSLITSVPIANTTYVDSSLLTAGTVYYYVVTSVASGGMESGYSAEVSAVIPN
jgi:hypothetical protein